MTWRPEWEEQPRRSFGFGGGVRGWGIAKTLVATCVAVTLISMIMAAIQRPTLAGTGREPTTLITWLGLSLHNALWIYPWLTYVFPHDIEDVWHIVVNGVFLWYLGIELEQRLGRSRFLTLFFGAAFIGAVAHVVIQAAAGVDSGSLIGASGGIFGLLFYIARESPNRPFVFFIIPVPAKVLAGLYLILNLFPLIAHGLTGDGVAHLCHLGGAAFGFAYFARPFDAFEGLAGLRDRWRAHADERQRERVASDDAEMDRLLQKIHDQGIGSLTEPERTFLDERSRDLRGGRR